MRRGLLSNRMSPTSLCSRVCVREKLAYAVESNPEHQSPILKAGRDNHSLDATGHAVRTALAIAW